MSSVALQYRVPASIILCGEYFITQPNNSAICMAIDRYAHLKIRIESALPARRSHALAAQNIPQYATRIESIYENTTQEWESLCACPLLSYAHTVYEEYLARYRTHGAPLSSEEWATDVCFIDAVFDTRAFFGAETHPHDAHHDHVAAHTKLGFGSSEAMAVLSCVFLLVLSNIDPLSCLSVLAEHARNTHTRWQHNRGSGYGVYASVFGGIGRYTTTRAPSWNFLPIPKNIQWFFLKENIHVASSQAIKVFQEWCRQCPRVAKKLSDDMNTHVRRYPVHEESELLIAWLQTARALGVTLGKAIGVSAEIPTITEHIFWKAVGAGNECAVGCAAKDTVDTNTIVSHPNICAVEVGKGLRCDTP